MATINLFGASGHGKVIRDIILSQGDKVGVFYDDAPACGQIHGISVKSSAETAVSGPLIISIGSNNRRKNVADRYDVEYARAISPTAIISEYSNIGEGSVVMQGAIIQTDCSIGRHCIINSGASVDHECVIADFVHISPHATLCGGVTVGEGSWVGAGAVVIPGVHIGKWVTIGAGSVVLRDVPDNAVAFGNPCKVHHYK